MEPKKIILLSTSQSAFDQRLQKIAKTLHNEGAQVLWINRSNINTITPFEIEQKNIQCFFNKGILFYLEFNIRLFLELLFLKADIITANDADTLPAVWLLSFIKSFDLYYDSHEIFTEVPELEGKKWKKKIWGLVEKSGIKRAKKCYTVNQSLASFLENKYHQEFSIIMNVPQFYNIQNVESKNTFILYQGALNKGRGLDQIIEAMPGISIPLKIAGKGDLEASLKQKVKDLKLEFKVEFLGNLLPKQLREYTQQASIGLNLLEDSSLNYYFSLANKFFDYMHAGIPQVCMNFPEYAAINEKYEIALLIDDLTPHTLQNAIDKLLNDTIYYQTLCENARKAREQYQWKNETLILKKIYEL